MIILALPAAAQSVTYTKIGQWTDGPTHAVAADGTTVYYGGSANLQIADFSDPANPQHLGRVNLDGVVTAIALAGDYAYAGQQGASLAIVDVSDASNPTRVGTVPDLAGVDDVRIVESTAYVLEADASSFGNSDLILHVVDVSDPASPALQGSIDVGERSESQTPARIDIADGYAYVAARDGLHIVDVSDPASPAETALYVPSDQEESVEAVAVRGEYAYAHSNDSLRVIDISDPAAPVRAGATEAASFVTTIVVEGDYAYLSDRFQDKGLHVVDVSDPSSPSTVSYFEVGGFGGSPEVKDVAVAQGMAYLAATYEGILAVDVSDPADPTQAGALFAGGESVNVAVSGDYAYVVQSEDAFLNSGEQPAERPLWVVDVSNPANPQTMSALEVDGTNEGIAARGSLVFMARGAEGLVIVDASDSANPAVVGTVDKHAAAVAAGETYVYTLSDPFDGDEAFTIIDVSDPASPEEVGVYASTDRELYDMAVVGDYAYVSTLDPDGLLTLDLSNPSAPSEAGFVELLEGGPMAVGGGYAYVTPVNLFAEDSLRVVDLSDPANPTLFNTTELDDINSPNGMIYHDGFLFTDDGGAVNAYDVTDPANPAEANSYTEIANAVRLAIVDGTMYVAAAASGVALVDIEATGVSVEPTSMPGAETGVRIASAPNPFRTEAHVTLDVPRTQHIRLDVYDVLGRRVATLHDGRLTSGRAHRFTVEAGDLPSGVYFLRATGEGFTATRQMVRVR